MATTNLGKVSVTPKGEYDPLITYERLDIVNHNGSSYIVKQASTGVTPNEGEFYALIAEKGDGGSFVKKAYKTYAAMDADKVNIPANSSVDVTNDPDESKNGAYIYDGAAFTRSQYDSKVVTDKIIADTAIAVQDAINNTVISSGFVTIDSFELGATITQRNQALRHAADGKLYRWAGDLPKVVPANSTPENSGGISANAWLEVSDTVLRQELLSTGGASRVPNGSTAFSELSSFLIVELNIKLGSSVFLNHIHQDLDLEGEGRLYTYQNIPLSSGINIKTTNGYLVRPFDGKVFLAEFNANKTDYDKNQTSLEYAFQMLRDNNGGILHLGIECSWVLDKTYYINCSNITIDGGNSTVLCRGLGLAWHPHKLGAGNYHDITLKNIVFKGRHDYNADMTSIGLDGSTQTHLGYVHIEPVKCNRFTLTKCRFIESIVHGHNIDMHGCRDFLFTENKVLGSNSYYFRSQVESVQIQDCYNKLQGNGLPFQEGSAPFWDNVVSDNIRIINNTFDEYIDPDTGVVSSWCCRAVGNHVETESTNIIIEGNYIGNTNYQVVDRNWQTSKQSHPIDIYAGGNVRIANNTVNITNGGSTAIRCHISSHGVLVSGERAVIDIINNTVSLRDIVKGAYESPAIEFLIAADSYRATSDMTAEDKAAYVLRQKAEDKKGVSYTFSGNNIYVDRPESLVSIPAAVSFHSDSVNSSFNITNNNFELTGAYSAGLGTAITIASSETSGRSIRIENNVFNTDIDGSDITLYRATTSTLTKSINHVIINNNTHIKCFSPYTVYISGGLQVITNNTILQLNTKGFSKNIESGATGATGNIIDVLVSSNLFMRNNLIFQKNKGAEETRNLIRGGGTQPDGIKLFKFADKPSDSWGHIEGTVLTSGTTAKRPTTNKYVGSTYFDTTLGKPVYWTGTTWVDSGGLTVA